MATFGEIRYRACDCNRRDRVRIDWDTDVDARTFRRWDPFPRPGRVFASVAVVPPVTIPLVPHQSITRRDSVVAFVGVELFDRASTLDWGLRYRALGGGGCFGMVHPYQSRRDDQGVRLATDICAMIATW